MPVDLLVLVGCIKKKKLCYLFGRFAVVFIGSTLFALQQLSGINAVFYFSSTVFRSAGVSSNLANAFVGIVNLLGIVFINSVSPFNYQHFSKLVIFLFILIQDLSLPCFSWINSGGRFSFFGASLAW